MIGADTVSASEYMMMIRALRLMAMPKWRVMLGSAGAWKAAASMVMKVPNSRAA